MMRMTAATLKKLGKQPFLMQLIKIIVGVLIKLIVGVVEITVLLHLKNLLKRLGFCGICS